MKKIISLSICILAIVLVFTSCKKGDIGPQGPAGAQGAQGQQGAQGSQGPAGTANVIYSPWFTPGAWAKDTIYGLWGFNYNEAATGITQQVLDSSVVLTYGKLEGYVSSVWPVGQVSQLPITITYKLGGTTYNDNWSALATPGNLRVRFTDDQNYYTGISTSHQFRYVIIPGGAASNRIAQMSYKEICRKYNIPE
jgi:hypothetical protein